METIEEDFLKMLFYFKQQLNGIGLNNFLNKYGTIEDIISEEVMSPGYLSVEVEAKYLLNYLYKEMKNEYDSILREIPRKAFDKWLDKEIY